MPEIKLTDIRLERGDVVVDETGRLIGWTGLRFVLTRSRGGETWFDISPEKAVEIAKELEVQAENLRTFVPDSPEEHDRKRAERRAEGQQSRREILKQLHREGKLKPEHVEQLNREGLLLDE